MFQLNPNLRPFWLTPKPYKRLKGGRFSGKTHDAGGMAIYLARNYSLKFLCIRQFQNRISDSVYSVLVAKIKESGWEDEFDILKTSIIHKETGSSFLFYGIARNIGDIKGTEGVDICWIEEAEGLTEEQWAIIDPTIRTDGSEIWLLYNPQNEDDFVETKLPRILGDDLVTRHINYDENGFLSDTARSKAERLKEKDPEEYEFIYLGIPRKSGSNRVISRIWLEACIDAHKKLDHLEWTGRKILGYDVADDGADKNAVTGIDGSIIRLIDEWSGGEDEANKSCRRVLSTSMEFGSDLIGYDSIGVGASTGSTFNTLNFENHYKFNAGAKVYDPEGVYIEGSENDKDITNADFFSNLKAQAWWLLAERVLNTFNAVTKGMEFEADEMISISSDDLAQEQIEQLIDELSAPLKDYDNNSRVKVESKKDLKKRGIPSPNVADSAVIALSNKLVETNHKPAGILLRRR